MKRKDSESQYTIMDLGCGCWHCGPCADRKRMRAGLYVVGKLLSASGMIFEAESQPDQWSAQQKALKRLGASWVRFGPKHLPGIIVGVCPSPFGAPIVDFERAIVRVGEIIRGMRLEWKDENSRLRPISYSKDWTPPVDESRYELVEKVPCKNPVALATALNEIGVCATVKATDNGPMLFFRLPPDLTPEAVEKLKQVLSCLH